MIPNRLGWYPLTTALLLVGGVAFADGPNDPHESRTAADGFHRLFNGTDLTGWKEVQGEPGSFRVEDGILIGRRDREKRTAYWLSTVEKYSDFVIRLEYQLRPRGNSGVFIRVPHHKGRTSKAGMEIQLLDDGGKSGKPGAGDTGAVYSAVAPTQFASKPAGQWNEIEIRCEGDRVRVSLNGTKINDVDMSAHESLQKRPREGYIGLSAHTDVVKFRNVFLKDLKGGGK